MVQDVHLYYQQMAINYKEAEEKAKLDAVTLERKSESLLQAGELHKYNKARKETCQAQELARVLRQAAGAIPEGRRENGRAGRYQERRGPGNAARDPLRPVRCAKLSLPSRTAAKSAQAAPKTANLAWLNAIYNERRPWRAGNLACWLAGCLV